MRRAVRQGSRARARPQQPGTLRFIGRLALFLALLNAGLLVAPARAQDASVIRGEVRSDTDGSRIAGATVEVIQGTWRGGATTDSSGSYQLGDVPPGHSFLRIRHLGHEPFDLEIIVPSGQEVVLDLALAVRPVALTPVHVDGRGPALETDSVSAHGADQEIVDRHALDSSPGLAELGLGDAVRALPGNEPTDPGSILYVRGAAADLKLAYLNGAPVYAPFPLGGLIEPFAPGLLSRAEIYLGGAPARYDGGLSYVMDLRTRAGIPRGARTSGAVDLLSARLLGEAGIADRVSVIAAARTSHPFGVEQLLAAPIPYRYSEGFIRTDARFGSTAFLSITGFLNDEAVRVGEAPEPDSIVTWGNSAGSVRFGGQVGSTSIEVTAALGDYRARLPFTDTASLVAMGSARRTRLSLDVATQLGIATLAYGASVDEQKYHTSAAYTNTAVTSAAFGGAGTVAGVYAEGSGQLGRRLRLRGGLRADYFSSVGDLALAPRVAATLLITERAALTLAAGRYHQFLRPPDDILLGPAEATIAAYLTPLTVGKASHLTVSLDQDLGDGFRLGIEGFYKNFSDLPESYTVDANASGLDLWIRHAGDRWSGWLGYSLEWVWSEVAEAEQADFSGRHILSSGAGTTLGERTRIDIRFAYGAGLPYSPIPLGPGEETVTIDGAASPMSARRTGAHIIQAEGGTETAPLLYSPEEPFLRLDASVSQRWTPRWGGRSFEISPYLKLLNNLGRRDALFFFFDGTQPEPHPIGNLPVVPVAGVEWKF